MNRFKHLIILFSIGVSTWIPVSAQAEVIEIVTFTLKQGVDYETFAPLDKAVETNHVSRQPGFLSRETARGEKGEWLVIVRWKTAADADASMNSFMDAPAAAEFIDGIDTATMKMRRYSR